LHKYEKLIVNGPKATDVPLNNIGHYNFLQLPGPLPGDRFTSRSISWSEPNLLNNLMESADPFGGFLAKPGFKEAGPGFVLLSLILIL
jgi:hypothetical protein